jgi:hypothetical protein
MGRKLVLTGTKLTDLAAPRLAEIDVMESNGVLLLVDPTHPYQSWAAGVPADQAAVPNLAAKNAALATGLTLASVQNAVVGNVGLTGTKGKVERTSKGGLHGIISPTVTTYNTDGLQVMIPQALYDWIKLTAYTHNFYYSLWTQRTRAHAASADAENLSFGQIASGGGFLGMFTQKSNLPGTISGARAVTANVGPSFRNLANIPGTSLRDSAEASGHLGPGNHSAFIVGNRSTSNASAARLGKGGSHALYRIFLEDLTISGRTYAEVDALDYAQYTKHVLTPGGRYYGDTFTDPATIA